MSRLLVAPLTLLVAGACFAGGTTRAASITVQVINVCDDNGQNCALSQPNASTAYNPTAIQDIFNQAGLTVNLLAPVQFNSSAYLSPAVVDDPAAGYTTGNPTDTAHLLLNLPGHAQSTVPGVLDLYLVDTISHSQIVAGSSQAAPTLFGLALQNSNGAIATTGVMGGFVAGLDNVAHELGHNLGLLHVDGTPASNADNLMQGANRSVPGSACGIAGIVCNGTVGSDDALNAAQITRVQSAAADLFNVDGVTATATRNAICVQGSAECAIQVAVSGANTQSVTGIAVRFRATGTDPTQYFTPIVVGSVADPCSPAGSQSSLPDGSVEALISLQAGCLASGQTIGFSVANFQTVGAADNVQLASDPIYDLDPFSVQFEFSDGLTSTAAFDSSGVASSATPFALANVRAPDQTGPGIPIPTDPAAFNALTTVEDDLEDLVPVSSVPEPAAFAVLAPSLFFLLARRRG